MACMDTVNWHLLDNPRPCPTSCPRFFPLQRVLFTRWGHFCSAQPSPFPKFLCANECIGESQGSLPLLRRATVPPSCCLASRQSLCWPSLPIHFAPIFNRLTLSAIAPARDDAHPPIFCRGPHPPPAGCIRAWIARLRAREAIDGRRQFRLCRSVSGLC